MAAERGKPGTIWLKADLGPEAADVLFLDVRDPARLLAGSRRGKGPAEIAGDVVVTDGQQFEARPRAGGGLRVTRAMLWSLLAPCRAGVGCRLQTVDRLEAEQLLRSEGRRFWERLGWWQGLAAGLRGSCRDQLAGWLPAAGDLIGTLDRLAGQTASDPGGGWPVAAAPEPVARPETTPEPDRTLDLPEDPEELAAWLVSPTGLGRLYGPGFAPRGEQAEMAAAVARAVAENTPLLVEAGTGVGKTLAYLVPVVAAAARGQGRVVVSTYTRALQVQILDHDLPRIASLLAGLQVRLLMGRRNYLCRRRRLAFRDLPVTSFADACRAVSFRLWLAATCDGVREELTSHPVLSNHLGELFGKGETCSATICYESGECFVQRARRKAREADLLVVNHSLLLNDFAAGHSLIGDFALLVVDEAHRLPQVALDCHTIRCDLARSQKVEELLGPSGAGAERAGAVRELADMLLQSGAPGDAAVAALDDLVAAVRNCLAAYRNWWEALGRSFDDLVVDGHRPTGRVRVYDKAETFGPIRPATSRLLAKAAVAGSAFGVLGQRVEELPELTPAGEEGLALLAQAGKLLETLQQDVRFLTADEDPEWVTWLEPGAKSGVACLGGTPLEAGELLRESWDRTGLNPVLTSATLAVEEDFGHMLTELGLRRRQPPATTALVASPFDYARQSLLLSPSQFPAPDQADFGPAVASVLRALRRRVRRKTLVLFTSYQLLRRVAQELEEETPDVPDLFGPDEAGPGRTLELLTQASAVGAADLLDRFRRSRNAMLLGTSTFWEGVDFPGSDLEILVVTKLPFLVPADPWVEARCERIQAGGENPFTEFMVRDAVLRLRQGLGRLIRRRSDRGVIVLLDNRLHSKSYGVTFLASLPSAPRLGADPEELAAAAAEFFAATNPAGGAD